MSSFIDGMLEGLRKTGGDAGVVSTVSELRENQFGIPLRHYAQQYLFGATGLRIQVFNSIAGMKESCKSSVLFDLMGDVCAAQEDGGQGGLAVLYELEGKISPTLLHSILRQHGETAENSFIVRHGLTLEGAMKDLNGDVLPMYEKVCPKRDAPLIIGFDSIGGSGSEDTIKKLKKEGTSGKGYYDKAHFMKYFCENMGVLLHRSRIPVVIVCVNQEKEKASSTPYGPPQKSITGGTSQLFKAGHMISASVRKLASGDGNIVTLRTSKTSYCDPRKIEVEFRWNKFGKSEDDMYVIRFDWGLASARCLADPEKGVGEIRDIADVKVSDQKLVTCPQLGCRSVTTDEFEKALMSNEKVLKQLQIYQKIERLKDLTTYPEYVASLSGKAKPKEESKPKAKGKPPKKEEPAPVSILEVAANANA